MTRKAPSTEHKSVLFEEELFAMFQDGEKELMSLLPSLPRTHRKSEIEAALADADALATAIQRNAEEMKSRTTTNTIYHSRPPQQQQVRKRIPCTNRSGNDSIRTYHQNNKNIADGYDKTLNNNVHICTPWKIRERP